MTSMGRPRPDEVREVPDEKLHDEQKHQRCQPAKKWAGQHAYNLPMYLLHGSGSRPLLARVSKNHADFTPATDSVPIRPFEISLNGQ